MKISIVGGTGREGKGIAVRWARAGHDVVIGSRDGGRAVAAALELSSLAGCSIGGASNELAVARAELVLLAVPYTAHADTLRGLAGALSGKVLIDITVPLSPPRVRVVHLPPGQAAALEAQAIVGASVKVVAGLHHVGSSELADPDHSFDSDVLVCGDDADAKSLAIRLIGDLGLRALDAGPLANAVALEALTPVLLHLNKTYRAAASGIRVTGLPTT